MVVCDLACLAQQLIYVGEYQRPVLFERIERAGSCQRFERALVDRLRIEPGCEIIEVPVTAPSGALGDDRRNGPGADIAQSRKRIADSATRGFGAIHRNGLR